MSNIYTTLHSVLGMGGESNSADSQVYLSMEYKSVNRLPLTNLHATRLTLLLHITPPLWSLKLYEFVQNPVCYCLHLQLHRGTSILYMQSPDLVVVLVISIHSADCVRASLKPS